MLCETCTTFCYTTTNKKCCYCKSIVENSICSICADCSKKNNSCASCLRNILINNITRCKGCMP